VTDSMLPIIREMLDAGSDEERGRIMLRAPDAVLIKYRDQFEIACRKAHFDVGLEFIDVRRAAYHAVRTRDGRLPEQLAAWIGRFAAMCGVEG
jgi:hypothetical protein